MMFFTDNKTEISNFCIDVINKKRIYPKFVYLIEPGVRELRFNSEYKNIVELHKKVSNLQNNEYISIDYPCDMNYSFSDLFIKNSIENNIKYQNISHYICCIQSKFQDFNDFLNQTKTLKFIWEKSNKILAIGNLCRIMNPNSFTDKTFNYILQNCSGKHIHFYGLSIRLIKKYIPILEKEHFSVSVDSTKWTKRINKNGVLSQYICARKNTRNEYFLEYMKEISKYVHEINF